MAYNVSSVPGDKMPIETPISVCPTQYKMQKVLPRFELGSAESESAVITNYTTEPNPKPGYFV